MDIRKRCLMENRKIYLKIKAVLFEENKILFYFLRDKRNFKFGEIS